DRPDGPRRHRRVEEAAAMKGAVSPGTGHRYPLTMICAVLRVPRSTVLARANVSSRSSGSFRVFSPRAPVSRDTRFQFPSSWAGTWLSRDQASSVSLRMSRSTSSVFRWTLQRSGSSGVSGAGGSRLSGRVLNGTFDASREIGKDLMELGGGGAKRPL